MAVSRWGGRAVLNVCICDDDPRDLARIQALAEGFAQEHPEFPLSIQAFPASLQLLEHLDAKGGFDLYLLDILMPGLQGMELAERIRARNETAELIFLSSSPEYALEAFNVEASGYLLKPVEKERFDKLVLAAACRMSQPENHFLLLKTKDGLRKILFRELVLVESFNHNRVCSLAGGAKAVTGDTLTSIMKRLDCDRRFFSPHRAYIINMEYIAALNADHILLSTGQKIPVSRASCTALKRAYMDYLF